MRISLVSVSYVFLCLRQQVVAPAKNVYLAIDECAIKSYLTLFALSRDVKNACSIFALSIDDNASFELWAAVRKAL